MRNILKAVVVMFMLQIAVGADAASIVVVPGAKGIYYVKAVDFSQIGGVEIELQYDTTALSNPRIAQGPMLASSMFIPNPKFSASSVKIAAMSLTPITGSGDLATLTFDLKGAGSGTVSVVRSKLAAATGSSVKHNTPAPTPVVTAGTGSSGSTGGSGAGNAGSGSSGSGSGEYVSGGSGSGGVSVSGGYSAGTITLPQDRVAAAEAAEKTDYQPLVTDLRKDMTLPLGGTGGQQGSAGEQKPESAKEQQKKFVSYKSVLQLFKDFKGEKNSKSLIPLFAENSLPDFKQEPPIAFSDGKTPLKITIAIKTTGSESPKFMLQGANVKQLSGEGEGTVTWTVEAVPKKDVVEAVLTVIDGLAVTEFPLTVSPKIEPLLTKGKALSEADFTAYLAKPPKFDLNKDGTFDSVDDYIYTANYIIALQIKPEKAKTEEKKETPKTDKKGDSASKEPARVKDEKAKPAGQLPLKPTVKPPVKP